MKCTRPIYALDLGIDKSTGKRKIKILPKRVDLSSLSQLHDRYDSFHQKSSVLALPCGKCLACRLNKAKEWAVRCVLEASLYSSNYFITLTYNDDNQRFTSKAVLEDLKKFIKKLRYRSKGVRYFGCIEHGSKNGRLHAHLILFNLELDDLHSIGSNLFESKIIDDIWPFGFHYIGEVTYSSCNYVARYTTKKVFNDVNDERILMSLKPGIGAEWFKDNITEVLDDDCIYGDFGNIKVSKMPRYFEKLADALDPAKLTAVKDKRIDNSLKFTLNEVITHSLQCVEELYDYKEKCQLNDFKRNSTRR